MTKTEMLQTEIVHEGTTTILRLVGEVSVASCDKLDAACTVVIAGKPVAVIIDASKLTYVSSIGMGCFVRLHRALRDHQGKVTFAGTLPAVQTALHRAKLQDIFDFVPDVASAKARSPVL